MTASHHHANSNGNGHAAVPVNGDGDGHSDEAPEPQRTLLSWAEFMAEEPAKPQRPAASVSPQLYEPARGKVSLLFKSERLDLATVLPAARVRGGRLSTDAASGSRAAPGWLLALMTLAGGLSTVAGAAALRGRSHGGPEAPLG